MSFYKGILPPILAETPKRATKFFTFEQYKKVFTFGDGPAPLVCTMQPCINTSKIYLLIFVKNIFIRKK